MGSYARHVLDFREDIKDLAGYQKHLFYFRKKPSIKGLTEKLGKEGFKPYAVSTGDEPLNKILGELEIAKETVRVIDSFRVSKRFEMEKVYLIYKYEEVKTRSHGPLSGAPLQMAHCGRYSA